jgi:cell wall-associated NlpC family hydrolase
MTQNHHLNRALQAACEPFADARTNFCQLEITSCRASTCALAGETLDRATLDAVIDALATDFPNLRFDSSAVRILHRDAARWAVVATNVAGVYAQTSVYSELVTQVMAGWRLEILKEREGWAFTRQEDGYLGWINRRYLAETRQSSPTHLVAAPVVLLHEGADATAPLAGRLSAGAFVSLIDARDGWALLDLPGGQMRWTPSSGLRALDAHPTSPEALRRQMIEDALAFVGLPYVWGGASGFGIDCSGFARLIHLLNGVAIPRDADMQFLAGSAVDEPFQPGDLLFFRSKDSHRIATHVGVSLGGWRMIHASISRNGVYVDDVQQTPHLRETFVGARSFLNPP